MCKKFEVYKETTTKWYFTASLRIPLYDLNDIQAVSGALNTLKQRKNMRNVMILSLVNVSEKLT